MSSAPIDRCWQKCHHRDVSALASSAPDASTPPNNKQIKTERTSPAIAAAFPWEQTNKQSCAQHRRRAGEEAWERALCQIDEGDSKNTQNLIDANRANHNGSTERAAAAVPRVRRGRCRPTLRQCVLQRMQGYVQVQYGDGFFRRSVRFQKLYHCPFNRQCNISKIYRNCCRACRFQKCILVGLDPKFVQGDWGTNASAAAAKKLLCSTKVKSEFDGHNSAQIGQERQLARTPAQLLAVKSEPIGEENDGDGAEEKEEMVKIVTNKVRREEMAGRRQTDHHRRRREGSALMWQNSALNASATSRMAIGFGSVSCAPFQPGNINDCQALANFLVSAERYCDHFVDSAPWDPVFGTIVPSVDMDVPLELAFRQPRTICPRYPLDWMPRYVERGGSIFAALFSRLLVHQFDWFSHLPELAALSDEDRRILLKRRTMRAIWFTCALRSVPFEGEQYPQGLCVTAEVFHPRDPTLQSSLDPCIRGLLSEAVSLAYDELIVPMRRHRISEAESALLRAISLFTPVARLSCAGLELVRRTQNKYLGALSGVVHAQCARKGGEENPVVRMGHLLMLLPALEQTAKVGDETFSMFHAFSMNGLQGRLNYELHLGGD